MALSRTYLWRRNLLLAHSLVILASCDGGDGSGIMTAAPLRANFSSIQANVFTPTCATSGCHAGATAPQGLRLDSTSSFGLLVGVPSTEEPAILRVAPGDPDNSYLVQKLEGTASTGQQMPLNGPPLARSTIDTIRQWIVEGAVDDRDPSTSAIRVSSVTPPPDAELSSAPDRVSVDFDREVDASTVNANTFRLEASGGDGGFDDGNETELMASDIFVPAANSRSAVFDLDGIALVDDTYRVVLAGAGASIILDLDANALDGEFDGAFPSGDGRPGGDFESVFSLEETVVVMPTLDDIQASVFGPTCSSAGCHSGGGAALPGVMDLTNAQASFDNLVNIASLEVPALLRVEPGNPDDSYLIHKLEGTAAVGGRMPAGSPEPLDDALIDAIRQWIAAGAPR